MDEDLIVLGAPAETQAAGGETSNAEPVEGHLAGGDGAATPGQDTTEQTAEPSAAAKPEPAKGDGDGEGEPEKPKKRTGIHRMQDRIARLEAENASLRSAAPAAGGDMKAAIEKEIGAPPKEGDYTDYLDYEDARHEYRIRKVNAEERIRARDAQATSRRETARSEAMEAFRERQDEAREKIADYDKVLASAGGIDPADHVTELVVESEKGALLAYHLAKNPAELDRLNRMSPIQAAKAVGALESRLTLAKPKTATSAPVPAKPVSGAAKPSSPDSDLEAWLAKKYG